MGVRRDNDPVARWQESHCGKAPRGPGRRGNTHRSDSRRKPCLPYEDRRTGERRSRVVAGLPGVFRDLQRCGNGRAYHVRVVYVTEAGIRVIEPIPNGRRLFRPTCFDPEYPNVAAIGWLGHGSDRLAIAVEVPPHSSCASMGTFKAFVIQLPEGKVVSRFGQLEAKKAFADLIGNELAGS